MKCSVNILCFIWLLPFIITSCKCNRDRKDSSIFTSTSIQTVAYEGGVYHLSNGAVLYVPLGAISDSTDITVNILQSNPSNETNYSLKRQFLTGISLQPHGLILLDTVVVEIPLNYSNEDLPMTFYLDENFSIAEGNFFVELDPDNRLIRIHISHFSTYIIEIIESALEQLFSCRDGLIRVQEASISNIDSEGCQAQNIKGSVQFMDCTSDPTESYEFTEISEECSPILRVWANKDNIEKGGNTIFNLELTIGSLPLPNQEISLSTNSYLTINEDIVITDNNGLASLTVTGSEVGAGQISADVNAKWYIHSIKAGTEWYRKEQKDLELDQIYTIVVVEDTDKWHGIIQYEMYDVDYAMEMTSSYTADFTFEVNSNHTITGSGTGVVQSVQLTPLNNCFIYENLNVTRQYNIRVEGNFYENNELSMKFEDAPSITFTSRCICPDWPEEYIGDVDGYIHPDAILIGNTLSDDQDYPLYLQEGTFERGFDDGVSSCHYILTLSRE